MVNLLATIAGPSGLLAAIEARAERSGMNRTQLLKRAGVTQAQFDALAAALAGADGATFRRLANATRAQAGVFEQTVQVEEGLGGVVDARSYGPHHATHHGDLG